MKVDTVHVAVDMELRQAGAASIEVLLNSTFGENFKERDFSSISHDQMVRLNSHFAVALALMCDIQVAFGNGRGFAATLRSFVVPLDAGQSPVQHFQGPPGDTMKH